MNTQTYIDKFIAAAPKVKCAPIDRTWYKQRFQWRVTFFHKWESLRFIQHILGQLDRAILEFKTRTECGRTSVFTNDYAVLDYILNDSMLMERLEYVTYSSIEYIDAVARLSSAGIANDVKFVKQSDHNNFIVTVGRWQWEDKNAAYEDFRRYVLNNIDVFPLTDYTKEKLESGSFYWSDIHVMANDINDIMMLHIVCPNNIVKVTKVIQRGTLSEDFIS